MGGQSSEWGGAKFFSEETKLWKFLGVEATDRFIENHLQYSSISFSRIVDEANGRDV